MATRTRKKPKGHSVKTTSKTPKSNALDVNSSGSSRDEVRAVQAMIGLYIAGVGAHRCLEVFGDFGYLILVEACIVAATCLLVWRLWVMMGPRRKDARENMAMAFASGGIGLAITVWVGVSPRWAIAYWTFGPAIALVCLLQESRRVKGRGTDAHPVKGITAEDLGLAPGTAVHRTGSDAVVEHVDGQDTSDVRSNLVRWESLLKLRPGTLLARVGLHRGQTRVTPVDVTSLDQPIPWPGPSRSGGSISEPLRVGQWADGDVVESVWREHSMTMGCTGSGKTSGGSLIKAAEMLTRTDVCLLWCDPVKGLQSAGPVASGVTWAATTEAEARSMVNALIRSIAPRTAALAALRDDEHPLGYTRWEPRAYEQHGIPQVHVQFEEAGWLVDHGGLIQVAERARSAGISFDMSLQRATHDRMDTSIRSNLTRRICFGVMDLEDATYCLSERTLAAGGDPSHWEDRQPGMAILQARDVPDRKVGMPMRWFMSTRDGVTEDMSVLEDVVKAHATSRAALDPVTANSFGRAYQSWTQAQVTEPGAPSAFAAVADPDDDDSTIDDITIEEDTGMDLPSTDGVDLTGIDAHSDAVDVVTTADDVDFGDLAATRLTTGQRNERFRQMLSARWRSGQASVTQAELSREWHDVPGGGGKPWPYYRLKRLGVLTTPDGSPHVARDEQDPAVWHLCSDPATWDTDALAGTESDDDEVQLAS